MFQVKRINETKRMKNRGNEKQKELKKNRENNFTASYSWSNSLLLKCLPKRLLSCLLLLARHLHVGKLRWPIVSNGPWQRTITSTGSGFHVGLHSLAVLRAGSWSLNSSTYVGVSVLCWWLPPAPKVAYLQGDLPHGLYIRDNTRLNSLAFRFQVK